MRTIIAALWVIAGLTLGPVSAEAADKKDPDVKELSVVYDLRPAQEKLYMMLAKYMNHPDIVGTGCKRSALQVAENALFRYDIDTHFRELMKEMADGVRDGAKLGGAKTLSKLAEYAGQVASAYDMDQPEAALGQAIINDAVDWAVENAKLKTGNDKVDDAIKDKAKEVGAAAKKKLNDALFGGELSKRITEDCSTWPAPCGKASVTVEFQKPANGKRGGLFILVRGECDCKAKANTSQLREYQISMFAPLAGLDSRVEWRDWLKKAIDIKELLKSSSALKKGVDDALKTDPDAGKEPSSAEDLKKLVDDVTAKAGKASTIEPTLVLTPRFDTPSLDDIQIVAKCGCEEVTEKTPPSAPPPAPTGGGTGTGSPPVAENPCPECKEAAQAWATLGKQIHELEGQVPIAEAEVPRRRAVVEFWQQNLKKIDENPKYLHNNNPGEKAQEQREARAKIESAEADLRAAQARVDDLKAKLAGARSENDKAGRAFDECVKRCQGKKKGIGMVPASGPAKTKNAMIGIVLPSDCRTGETVSGTVVMDPRSYEHVPALKVVEVQAPITETSAGKGSLTGIVIDTDDGRTQRADEGLTVTVPNDGTPIHVALRRDDQDTPFVERTVPVTSQPTPTETTGGGDTYTTQPVCVHGATQVVHGHFDGDSRTTHIAIGGKNCTVIAETPRAAYWKIPDDTPSGPTTVTINEGTRHAELPVCVVSLTMSAAKLKLMRGESTTFTVVVSGLADLPESAWRAGDPGNTVDMGEIHRLAPAFHPPANGAPGVLLLTIENMSRDTITIGDAPGGEIAIELGRGKFTDGKFTYNGTIHSSKTGGFRINGMVVPFLAVEGTRVTTDRGNGPTREDNTGKKGIAGQNKKEDKCPDGSQPGSYMLADKVCRGGVWHWVRAEQWRCQDGTILSTVEIDDRPTKEPCVEVIP